MKGKLTVAELIETLQKLPKNAYVALSSDSEGNSYSIMMDKQFLAKDCYMLNQLGSQLEYFTNIEVRKAKKETNGIVDSGWYNKVKVKELTPVIILFGSN